jgi:hypothetical protein
VRVALALVVLAACAGEERSRDQELARRLDRVEASLERLADDQTLGRGQIDQLRAELAAVRAELEAPAPAPPAVDAGPPGSVTLSVVSVPTGAQVHVDGRLVGATPLIFSRPEDATSEVRISRKGYRDHAVTLKPGGPQQLNVTLRPRR